MRYTITEAEVCTHIWLYNIKLKSS